jgi:hypothetical protein
MGSQQGCDKPAWIEVCGWLAEIAIGLARVLRSLSATTTSIVTRVLRTSIDRPDVYCLVEKGLKGAIV